MMNKSGATMTACDDTPEWSWLDRIPKVELHLHLEGAIPHDVLWELLQKYGGDPEVPTREALAGRLVYRDFPHFLDMWTWKNGFLRQYEDFEFTAAEVARDLARQNIRYVEAFYSPSDFFRLDWSRNLSPRRFAAACDKYPRWKSRW
jgi:adenosine deaminase